jgi:hypothetical protein
MGLFDIRPKKKAAFTGRQSYWKAAKISIPKQRNDDERLGTFSGDAGEIRKQMVELSRTGDWKKDTTKKQWDNLKENAEFIREEQKKSAQDLIDEV